jgi:hypothetical protein
MASIEDLSSESLVVTSDHIHSSAMSSCAIAASHNTVRQANTLIAVFIAGTERHRVGERK